MPLVLAYAITLALGRALWLRSPLSQIRYYIYTNQRGCLHLPFLFENIFWYTLENLVSTFASCHVSLVFAYAIAIALVLAILLGSPSSQIKYTKYTS